MKVTLLDHMGTDLTVVNAARVSFDKKSEWEYPTKEIDISDGYASGSQWVEVRDYAKKHLSDRDTKLIDFLAREKHDLVFTHCMAQVHVKAPLFVARQLWKSHIGAYMTDGVKGEAWNEVSRRYVDSEPEFYEPESWRGRAANTKQGSSDVAVESIIVVGPASGQAKETTPGATAKAVNSIAMAAYRGMVESGVCPEQARMVLPQSMMTEWIWTGSLLFFSRVVRLRADSHAQKEAQEIANQIAGIIQPLFPVSWEALMRNQ